MNPFKSTRKPQLAKAPPRSAPPKEVLKPKASAVSKAAPKVSEEPAVEVENVQDDEDSLGSIPDFPAAKEDVVEVAESPSKYFDEDNSTSRA